MVGCGCHEEPGCVHNVDVSAVRTKDTHKHTQMIMGKIIVNSRFHENNMYNASSLCICSHRSTCKVRELVCRALGDAFSYSAQGNADNKHKTPLF